MSASDSDFEEESDEEIELGYVQKAINNNYFLPKYFPSKVGGRPAWINPRNLPEQYLICKHCSNPLRFILQSYEPGDEGPSYHQTFYVFACANVSCVNKYYNLKVFRGQLPRVNEFWPASEPADPPSAPEPFNWDEPWTGVSTCHVCGLPASKRCSQCQTARYCSPEHQLMDWKAGHSKTCSAATASGAAEEGEDAGAEESASASDAKAQSKPLTKNAKKRQKRKAQQARAQFQDALYPEAEITSEAEPKDDFSHELELAKKNSEEESVMDQKEREEEAANFDDKDWKSYRTANVDPIFTAFSARVAASPDQVIRFGGKGPLWVAAHGRVQAKEVPPCPRCKSAREYRFQILPQLLHYLRIDPTVTGALDWGTLAVFSCARDCGDGRQGYFEEFIWRQSMEEKDQVSLESFLKVKAATAAAAAAATTTTTATATTPAPSPSTPTEPQAAPSAAAPSSSLSLSSSSEAPVAPAPESAAETTA